MLGQYSEAQRRYNPFSNEWDCCEEFGPGDEEDDMEFDGLLSFPGAVESSSIAPYDMNTVPVVLTPPPLSEQLLDAERLDVPRVHSFYRTTVSSPKPTLGEFVSQSSP